MRTTFAFDGGHVYLWSPNSSAWERGECETVRLHPWDHHPYHSIIAVAPSWSLTMAGLRTTMSGIRGYAQTPWCNFLTYLLNNSTQSPEGQHFDIWWPRWSFDLDTLEPLVVPISKIVWYETLCNRMPCLHCLINNDLLIWLRFVWRRVWMKKMREEDDQHAIIDLFLSRPSFLSSSFPASAYASFWPFCLNSPQGKLERRNFNSSATIWSED